MEVELPSGVAGVLSLPRLGISNPAVKVDGRRKLHSLQADAHFITLPVGPGKHSLTLSGAAER